MKGRLNILWHEYLKIKRKQTQTQPSKEVKKQANIGLMLKLSYEIST